MIIAAVVASAIVYAAYAGLRRDAPQPAPAAAFGTLEGERITTSSLRGKVVLVNFWATSCVTCVQEMPKLVATYRRYRDRGFETIAVAMSYDPPNYVLHYAAKNALPFKVALDPQGETARAFGEVQLTPTTFVIDRRGMIVKRYVGEPDFAELDALIEGKLAEAGRSKGSPRSRGPAAHAAVISSRRGPAPALRATASAAPRASRGR